MRDRFTFDGEEFDIFRLTEEWTIAETIQIEDFFERDTEFLGRTRRFAAVLWVSVHRVRPEFTLAQAIGHEQGAVVMVAAQPLGQAVAAAADAALAGEPGDVVLTPTSADTEPVTAPSQG